MFCLRLLVYFPVTKHQLEKQVVNCQRRYCSSFYIYIQWQVFFPHHIMFPCLFVTLNLIIYSCTVLLVFVSFPQHMAFRCAFLGTTCCRYMYFIVLLFLLSCSYPHCQIVFEVLVLATFLSIVLRVQVTVYILKGITSFIRQDIVTQFINYLILIY